MPTDKFVEFILYVLPGFLAIEIYRSAYPAKSKNNFSLVTWSVIFGVLIVTLINLLDSSCLNYYLESNKEGFPGYKYILALLIGGLLLGYLRILIHYLRFKISTKYEVFEKIAPNPLSIWAKINQKSNNDWAIVYLDDQTKYLGYISDYKFDPDSENQDFLLKEARCVDDDLNVKYIVTGIGVYLNTKNVKRIEFLEGKSV